MDAEQSVAVILGGLRKTFISGSTLSCSARYKVLNALKTSFVQHRTEIEDSLAQDLARCKFLTMLTEYSIVVKYLDHTLSELKNWVQHEPKDVSLLIYPGRAYLKSEPLGVALVMGSWNFPYVTTLNAAVSALAAGNCVCLKPSELAPQSSKVLANIINCLNNPALRCLEGGTEIAVALLEERWDVIAFTGSPAKGKLVAAAAAKHLTPTVLELGGKNPVIVDRDADLELASSRVLQGRFLNCGQICLAPDLVWVHESVLEPFLVAARETLLRFYGANPQKSPDLGRIVNEGHFERVCKLLQGHGGQVVVGGQTDRTDRYVSPTIVLNPQLDSPLATEEVFGPILIVISFRSLEDCVEQLKTREKPLALYYFGKTHRAKEYVLQNTSSGGFVWNDAATHGVITTLPFGGVGNSGMGVLHGKEGFWAFSNRKGVLEATTLNGYPSSMRYPPHTEGNFRNFGFLVEHLGISVAAVKRALKKAIVIGAVAVAYRAGYLNGLLEWANFA